MTPESSTVLGATMGTVRLGGPSHLPNGGMDRAGKSSCGPAPTWGSPDGAREVGADRTPTGSVDQSPGAGYPVTCRRGLVAGPLARWFRDETSSDPTCVQTTVQISVSSTPPWKRQNNLGLGPKVRPPRNLTTGTERVLDDGLVEFRISAVPLSTPQRSRGSERSSSTPPNRCLRASP